MSDGIKSHQNLEMRNVNTSLVIAETNSDRSGALYFIVHEPQIFDTDTTTA